MLGEIPGLMHQPIPSIIPDQPMQKNSQKTYFFQHLTVLLPIKNNSDLNISRVNMTAVLHDTIHWKNNGKMTWTISHFFTIFFSKANYSPILRFFLGKIQNFLEIFSRLFPSVGSRVPILMFLFDEKVLVKNSSEISRKVGIVKLTVQ